MKKQFIIGLTLLLAVCQLNAQELDKRLSNVGLSVSAGSGVVGAASYEKLYGLGSKNRFKVGFGLRLTVAAGSNLAAETAPTKVRKVATQIDILHLPTFNTNSLNAAIYLQYSISPKIDAGFNIDAIGVSFGGEQAATFKPQKGTQSATTAKPTGVNVLLVGDNDIGSLNSEFFARYWITEKLGIKAGLNYQFVEYTAAKKLAYDNDRFRGKLAQPMVGISWKL